MKVNTYQYSKKNVAAIVAVTLVFGMMIGFGIQTTEAAPLAPKSYGSATSGIVCGDKLCNGQPQQVMNIDEAHIIGIIDRNDSTAPHAEVISIEKYGPNTYKQDAITYKITYRLTSGQEDLDDIQIRVVTDMGVWDYEISSLNSHSSSINVARLKALDPNSISGEIIGYTIRQ